MKKKKKSTKLTLIPSKQEWMPSPTQCSMSILDEVAHLGMKRFFDTAEKAITDAVLPSLDEPL